MRGIMIPILAIVIAGAISAVYAEQTTINVPFQSEGFNCTYQESSTTETYSCVFIAEKPFGITVRQDNLTEQEVDILEDIEEARENGTYEEPPRFDYKFGAPIDEPDEGEKIDPRIEICAKRSLSSADTELCRLIEALDQCHRGFGKLETIQEVSSFEVTLIAPNIWESWELQNSQHLKRLLLAYEECRALQTEHNEVLSAMYWDFVVDGIMEPQFYHGDIAKDLIPFPSNRLTANTFLHSLGNAYDMICNNNFYKEQFKVQQGCTPQDYEEGAEFLPNPDKNMDDYYNSLSPMQRYKAYQEDPTGFQPDQLIYGEVGDWKINLLRK